MEITRQLEELGLTSGESNVYVSLLELGPSGVGDIVTKSGVSSSKVYDILERLAKKGFVGSIVVKGRKQFEAQPPKRLTQYLELKQQQIDRQKKDAEQIIAHLNTLQNSSSEQEAEILQGLPGIKTFCEIALENMQNGDTFYILGALSKANEMLGGYFQDWHERRVSQGINCKILFNADSKKWAKRREKTNLTHIRFLPDDIISPVMIDISPKYVATIIFSHTPICILVKNKTVAQSYIKYFEMLWEKSG